MEFIDSRVHLHPGHVELDMVLILSQIGDDCFRTDVHKAVVDELDLRLGLVLAVCSRTAEACVDGAKVSNTVLHVGVVALVESFSRLLEPFDERVLVCEARSKVVVVLLLSEHLDRAADVACDLLARLRIRKRIPFEIALFFLFNREHAMGKSFASF